MAYRVDSKAFASDRWPRNTPYPTHTRSREHSPISRAERGLAGCEDYSARQDPHQSLYPPSRPFFAATPHSYSHPPRPPRRSSWPCHSIVEDERTSLAKEADPLKADADDTGARSPGLIDQVPLILPADEPIDIEAVGELRREKSHRRKHDPNLRVKVARKNEAVNATASRGHDKDLKLGKTTEIVDSAERQAAPHVFTPKREPKPSPTDSGYCSSTDLLAEKRKQARAFNDVAMSDALRGQGKARERHHVRRASGLSYDGETRRRPPQYPVHAGPPRDKRAPHHDDSTRPRLAAVKADALGYTRRSSDTATTLPRVHFRNEVSTSPTLMKAPPLASLAAKHTEDNAFDNRSETSSRPPSPGLYTPMSSPSPSRSPRPEDRMGRAGRSAMYSAYAASKTSSRDASPTDPMRRSETFPNLQQDRRYHAQRLPDSTFPLEATRPRDAYGSYPSLPPTPSTASSALPYPVDDMGIMPSIDDHRYRPRLQDGLTLPSIPAHRVLPIEPPSPTFENRTAHGGLAPRPRLPSRHTANDAPPSLRTTGSVMSEPLTSSPVARKAPAYRVPKAPKPCSRSKASSKHRDWYTLVDVPEFDICPDCFYNNFVTTRFHDNFQRAKQKAEGKKTKCDFANEWVRLAWLMTQQQGRGDLDLVYAVARIGARTPKCPGDHDEERTWFTLCDRAGKRVERFDVCRADAYRIEALMPELRGTFVKAYGNVTKVRMCDLRTQSHRFEKYLDKLYEVVETARIKRRAPDVQEFVDYVKNRAQVKECKRGEIPHDKAWHFIPQLKNFTVCEECFTDVVYPEIEAGYALANRFNKTPQVLYSDQGESCQLYSMRMRKIFKEACIAGDYEKLERRALERKDKECKIKGQELSARKLLKRASSSDSVAKVEQLKWDLERMAQEWKQFE